jgi:hypothetical protein
VTRKERKELRERGGGEARTKEGEMSRMLQKDKRVDNNVYDRKALEEEKREQRKKEEAEAQQSSKTQKSCRVEWTETTC